MRDPWETIKVTVAEIRVALSPQNMYFAAQKLGREPTALEAVIHYLNNTPPKPTHIVDVEPRLEDGNGLFI